MLGSKGSQQGLRQAGEPASSAAYGACLGRKALSTLPKPPLSHGCPSTETSAAPIVVQLRENPSSSCAFLQTVSPDGDHIAPRTHTQRPRLGATRSAQTPLAMAAAVRFKDQKSAGNGGLNRTGSGQGYGLRRCGLDQLAGRRRCGCGCLPAWHMATLGSPFTLPASTDLLKLMQPEEQDVQPW